MGGLFGGKSQNVNTSAPVISGLQLQTSAKGRVLAVGFGKSRLSPNVIDYQDFTAIPHTETQSSGGGGGKGGGGGTTYSNTTYTYTVCVLMALCDGAIAGVPRAWIDKAKYNALADTGLSLYSGSASQTPFGYMSSAHPDRALGYRNVAYLAAAALDLGNNGSLPNHSFEVDFGNGYSGSIPDAEPGNIIAKIATHARYGAGFPAAALGDLTGFTQYCIASGLFLSPIYSEQTTAQTAILEIADLCDSYAHFSNGQLTITPRADDPISGNGVTYTPDLTPLYDLSDEDFHDTLRIVRDSSADAYNCVTVKFRNRDTDYNDEIAEAKDQADVELYGLRQQQEISADSVVSASVAARIAQLKLQRNLGVRNKYEFVTNIRYMLLEPCDYVTLTDPWLGLDRQLVRITSKEDDHGDYTFGCEEVLVGVAKPAEYEHLYSDAYAHDYNADPGDCTTPQILESPSYMSTTGLMLGVATNGQQPAWGGCDVWVSLDGNSYRRVGSCYGGSRYGIISSPVSGAGGQPVDVSLVGNAKQLISVSQADADANTALAIIGDEMVSYSDAVLTSANEYAVSLVNRGVHDSVTSAHIAGERFVRIDESVEWGEPLDIAMIGSTVYFKLPSFNIYGGAPQSLSDVIAYQYTITGRYVSAGGFIGELPIPAIVNNFSCNVITDTAYLAWSRDPQAEGLSHYEIRLAELPSNNQAVSWERAAYLATIAAGTETAALPAATGVYLIRAVNLQGKRSPAPASILSNVRTALDYTPVLSLDLLTPAILTDADTRYTDTVYTVGDAPSVSLNNIDTMTDWLSMSDIRSLRAGLLGVIAEGYYYPAAIVDFENVYSTRIKTDVQSHSDNIDSVIEQWLTLSSLATLSEVDGEITQARLQVSTSLDAVTWADWQPIGVIADITARYYKFRVRLATTGEKVTPILTRAVASFTMASRLESGNDVDIPAAGMNITFSRPYKDAPALGVTLERLLGNWSYTLTNKNATGFTVQLFKDNAPTAGRIDWLSNGYGLGQIIT